MEIDIGSRLREAREEKGMSLEEIQQVTKIQKRYIQAIEKNEFGTLPGKFYTRAFIREYASAVGLDPEQVMEEHKAELPTYEDEEMIKYSRVQKSKKQAASRTARSSKILPIIMTFVVIIGILFAIWFFYQQAAEPESDSSPPDSNGDVVDVPEDSEDSDQSEGEDVDQGEETGADSTTADNETEEPNASENNRKQSEVTLVQEGTGNFPEHTYEVTGIEDPRLVIELTGRAYLEVRAPKDGENLISPIEYTSDDSPIELDISDKKQVYIKTGATPNTIVKVNGQEVEFPAEGTVAQKLLINFK